jgi:hypothetical protein
MFKNIQADNFKAKCKCLFPWISCSCKYENNLVKEGFCDQKNRREVKLNNRHPLVQTNNISETGLYLRRTQGPGQYAYAQPKINNYCFPQAVGYSFGRNGLLPVNKEEVDIESKLRYSEELPIAPSSRGICNDASRESKYTKDIKPCNDISATPFDRWEFPLCDPQQNIATSYYQFGKDTKNYQKDAFYAKYKKCL